MDLLVGEQATALQVKKALRRRVIETEADDLLLVYFSGHAFVPLWSWTSDVYPATHDLSIDALEEEPDAGLWMFFLRHDIFETVRSASILLLDCCMANDYLSARAAPVVQTGLQGGHAALLAYSPGASAKEKDSLQHGEFTSALGEAFRGDDNDIDQLTMESLH